MDGAVQQVLQDSLLRAAQTVEAQLDAQLQKLDNLEEDDLDRIRQKRIDDMKRWERIACSASSQSSCLLQQEDFPSPPPPPPPPDLPSPPPAF